MIYAINLTIFCVEFVSNTGLYQNVMPACLDQQTGQTQTEAIAVVGRDSFLPQRLGNNREHLPSIELEGSIGYSVEVEYAKFHDSSINL